MSFQAPFLKRRIGWPETLAWIICFTAAIMTLLPHIGVVLYEGIAIQVVYSMTFFCAASIFLAAAKQGAGKRRWTWCICALSVALSGISALFGLAIRLQLVTYEAVASIQLVLLVLAYVFGLIAIAVYFPQKSWRLGSTQRVFIDSMVVGCATLVILQSLLPLLFPNWSSESEASGMLTFLALDTGIVFSTALVCMRIRFSGSSGRMIFLLFLSFSCQLFADGIYTLLTLYGMSFTTKLDLVVPLYMLQKVLWALSAYWSVQQEPQHTDESNVVIAYADWFVWTRVSRVLMVVAFATTILVSPAHTGPIIALVAITIIQEVWATYQERLVLKVLDQRTVDLGRANEELRANAARAEDLAAERERIRLAREIHDGLGHSFTSINMHIHTALAMVETDPVRASSAIRTAQALAKEGLAEVRRSVAALRNHGLNRPVEEAVSALIHEAQTSGLSVSWQVIGQPFALPTNVATTLYRAVQEGLTNVRKHAPAAQVRITLNYCPNHSIQLVVHDNGPGTDTTEGGFGLVGMRERVEAVGGAVAIVTAPDQGFMLTVEIPL